jgi:hypothetical protein
MDAQPHAMKMKPYKSPQDLMAGVKPRVSFICPKLRRRNKEQATTP